MNHIWYVPTLDLDNFNVFVICKKEKRKKRLKKLKDDFCFLIQGLSILPMSLPLNGIQSQ